MPDPKYENLERLKGYALLETPEGVDAYTLILRVESGEFACVADHQSLWKLAASIQQYVVPPQSSQD
jgi:hypothetical protein